MHEVFLVNAVSGGMKYLRLEPHIIYGYNAAEPPEDGGAEKHGTIHFKEYDYDSGTTKYAGQSIPARFFVTYAANSVDEFVLRPKGAKNSDVNACLMAKDPLSLEDCGSGSDVTWKVRKGRVVSKNDESSCIIHQLNNGKGVNQRCSSDANSYVSIVPVGAWSSTKFPQLTGVFPQSGIQLSGANEYSSITLRPDYTNTGLPMTETFAIELSFILESEPGTAHRVCLLFDDETEECFKLAGGGANQVKTVSEELAKGNSVVNEFLIQPWKASLSARTIEYLRFDQTGDATTRSRFSSIDAYDMVSAVVTQRLDTSLTFQLTFPAGTSSTTDLHYLPTVLLQDSEGNFASSVPNAEKLVAMDQSTKTVTITGLFPGRRFLIRLDPVQSTEDPFTDSRRTLKAFFKEYTSCSCNPSEETGQPQSLTVTQSGGKVAMAFMDFSECEEAYAFTRQKVSGAGGNPVAYSQNYFFFATKPCGEEKIEPGGEFKDEVSNLEVGESYRYCASAVGKEYMVDASLADGTFRKSSDPKCANHVAMWESSAVIKVTLRKEAGSLPVHGVDITWELRNPSNPGGAPLAQGTGETLSNGQHKISINNVAGLDSTIQYPLHVNLAKSTGDVAHGFLCDDEQQDCSMSEPVGYLGHLNFGQVISIADKTSVPLRGKVYIQAPEYATEGGSCPSSPEFPLRGATVCLVRKSKTTGSADIVTSTCVVTQSDGAYELPATFGTTVYPSVTYNDHTFQYVRNFGTSSTPADPINATGLLITESGYENSDYENHDFVDIKTEEMIVEVAGGLCNIALGTSTLQVSFVSYPQCYWVISQDGYKSIYTMPAHKLSVSLQSLTANKSRLKHENYLQTGVGAQIVDLTEVEDYNSTDSSDSQRYDAGTGSDQDEVQNKTEGTDSLIEKEKAAVESLRTARFQYDGDVLIFPQIESGKDHLGGNCNQLAYKKIDDYNSESTHVVKTGALFELAVIVRQEILRDEKVFCDTLGTDDEVDLFNRVGLRASDQDDQKILSLLTKGGADVSYYKKCTEGCSLPIKPPPPGTRDKSYAIVVLQAGTPNPTGDLLKYINIGFGNSRHTMNVFVTGDRSTGGVPFSMPTHFPLLVIRDPPGGSSYATYENMQHTASITMESYEKYLGIDAGVSLHVALLEGKSYACAGSPGLMACDEKVETDNYITPSVEASGNFLSSYEDDAYTHGFTVQWSYSTSDEITNPGNGSDVIVVPVINIKHTLTDTVTWNETICEANATQSTKIDLQSPENQRAFSVITTHHAKTVEIPRIEKLLKLLQSSAEADTGNISATDEFKVTQASYLSWKQFMDDYDKTNTDNGLLNVGRWFNWYSDNRIKPNCTILEQSWGCINPESNDTESDLIPAFRRYRCNPVVPDIAPVSRFNEYKLSGEDWKEPLPGYDLDIHFDGLQPRCLNNFHWVVEGGLLVAPDPNDPICPNCTEIVNYTVSSSKLPEDHEYWKEWSLHNPLPTDTPHTGLAPNVLVDGAETNTQTEELAQTLTKSSLESTGRIIFSGGGGEFSMTLGSDSLKSLVSKYNGDADIGDFDNAQQGFSLGLEVNAGFEFSKIGGSINGQAAFHYSIDHKVLSSNEISEETSVSFSLSDPDVDDEFHVDILFDPKYGTFVFRTVGGQSKCPHEEGTSKLESPKISQIWQPSPNILPDEAMVFEVQIQNDGLGDSYFDLYAEAEDIEGGLAVDMLSPFFLESTAKNPNAITKTTVTVSRGPKLFSYSPVTIALRSGCEQRARARSTGSGSIAISTDQLFNVGGGADKKLEFLQPCPAVKFVGHLQIAGHFIHNENSGTTLAVQVFNPLYSKKGNFTSMKRKGDPLVEEIVLNYRRVGDLQWFKGQHDQNGTFADILFENQEDSYGYAKVDWYVDWLQEADYEIKVSVSCGYDSSLPDEMNSFSTEIIRGSIDRVKPSVMGYPHPQVNLVPGDDLLVDFTEDIWCDVPFNVAMEVEGIIQTFENGAGLDVVCSSNTLVIQFVKDDMDAEGYYDDLLSRNYTLTVSGVKDINGNIMQDYVYSSHFICLPPVPTLLVRHPAGNRPYLPDEPILFEVTLGNEARALSHLELGVDPRSNLDNLEVLVNGKSIAISHNYILAANETTTTVLSVSKGPGSKLRFSPVAIFLRSACAEDANNPVEVTGMLYNYDDSGDQALLFQHPCPSIRWAGSMHQFSKNMLNNEALTGIDSLIEVSIFNEGYTDRMLFDRSIHNTALEANRRSLRRLQDVVLVYRRMGDWDSSDTWDLGKLEHQGARMINGRQCDFSTESIENSFGYATLHWDVKDLPDSMYEVKVMSRCTALSNSHSELETFSTEIVQIVLDKTPPRVYGVPLFKLPSNYHPSHEFVIPFTEEIYCRRPYTFSLILKLTNENGVTDLRDNAGLHVKCEGKEIKYRFDAMDMSGYSSLTNSEVRLILDGVEDLARNRMSSVYDTSFTQCDQTLVGTNRIYVGMGCDGLDNDCDLLVDECDEDLVPPSISLPDVLKVTTISSGNDLIHTLTYPTCFDVVENARLFLQANIDVSDDCSRDVRLDVELETMTNAGLALFKATATDERCEGDNGIHFHSEYFHVEIFNGYDTQGLLSDNTTVRGMGCDRADQNCNGIIDDCDEDLVPPIISFKEALTVSAYEQNDGVTVIHSPAFASLDDAREYLESILKAEDDCATDLNIAVASPPVADCQSTVFTVTVTDPRCSETNSIQTVTKEYALWVDTIPPDVSIVLGRGPPESNRLYEDPDGQYVHIDQHLYDYENTEFSYMLQDNCKQEAQVKVTVLSNEFEYSHSKTSENMVLIEERDQDQSHRLKIFVEAKACHRDNIEGLNHDKPLCEWDTETSPFRFYNIKVEATDYAGNVGQAVVTVIILEEGYKDDLRRFGSAFDSTTFFIDFARRTPPRYIITTKELTWDTALPSGSSPTTPASTTTAAAQTQTAASVTTTIQLDGLAPPESEEEKTAMVQSIEEAIREVVAPMLGPNQQLSDITVKSIGDLDVTRRHLLVTTPVEFTVIVLDMCTDNCENVGTVVLEQMRDQVTRRHIW